MGRDGRLGVPYRFMMWTVRCSRAGHLDVRIEPQIGYARKPSAHSRRMRLQQHRVDAHPDSEHQPFALGLGLDRLGRELRLSCDERHLGRNCHVRIGIEHDPRSVPILARPASRVGR